MLWVFCWEECAEYKPERSSLSAGLLSKQTDGTEDPIAHSKGVVATLACSSIAVIQAFFHPWFHCQAVQLEGEDSGCAVTRLTDQHGAHGSYEDGGVLWLLWTAL